MSGPAQPRRRGRKPVLGDEALVETVREVLAEAEALVFWGEGYRKVWARLRFEGILTSKERVRCLSGNTDCRLLTKRAP